MASKGISISEDADMAECDGDKIVTMMDVLQEQQDFEEDANAVLGASDDKNCTYAKGYIKRQAIYACVTCCPDAKTDPTKRAGVCLACSLNCHENHELVELYTKRNFRCDCGNPKFNSHPCQFSSNKLDLNNDNIYNQNFSGVYCTCQRPYPDPESTFEDDMIQCIICEDWLHASHLDAVVPANDQYSEMICKACMEKNEFLHDYSNLAVNVETVDIITVNGNHSDDASFCNGDITKATKNPDDNDVLSNGDDVNKTDEKEKETSLSKDDECTATQEETKNTEETLEEPVETGDTDSKVDPDNVNKDIESPTLKTNEENNESEVPKEITPDTIENKDTTVNETTEQIENDTKEASEITEQKQNDEQSINDVNSVDDKTENNKTEDQLLDDIRELTSDNPSEQSTTNETTQIDEAEKETTAESNSNSEQTNESVAPSEAITGSECDKIEVPDISQEITKQSIDDKTDAVMDAIDALLESTTEAKACESDNKEESQKTNDVNTSENKELSENAKNSDTDGKPQGDVEMSDSTSHNELSTNENKVHEDSAVDSEKSECVDTTDAENKYPSEDKEDVAGADISNAETSKVEANEGKETESKNENKRKLSITEESSPKKVKFDASKCIRPRGVQKIHKGATFWPSNFRQKLCTCGECISMYKDLHVLFLTDPEDTVSFYESLGQQNVDAVVSQYEKGLQALSSLDRIQQINALTEYNKMRDKLLDFLKSFKDRKEIVKEEDIKAFFAEMKPRREPDGVYFCR